MQISPTEAGMNIEAGRPKPLRRSVGVAAVVLGNAMEFFDFVVYATFAVVIGQAFFPSDNPHMSLLLSVATFGVGFIVRPLGAWLIGAYADRAGRKPAMLFTVVLMGISTGAFAILPSYASIGIAAPILLVAIRMVQGLAWGGEAGPATTYILEAAPLHRRGLYACWQVIAQGLAAIVAGLVGYLLSRQLSPEALQSWGWRVPFLFGLLVLPIGIVIRRQLHDTVEADPEASTITLTSELFRRHWRAIALGILILSGSTITQYFLNYMTTYALTELHYPTSTSMLSTLVGGAALAVGALAGGWLCDHLGRRPVIIVPRLLLLLGILPALTAMTQASPPVFFAILTLLTLLHGISGAALIVLLAESFPSSLRATGFSVVYGIGIAVFGGTAQLVIAWLIEYTGDPISPAWYLIVANVACLVGALLTRETRPAT